MKFSGTQATGGLSQALAVVALAGTLLMLALRTRGRRVTGALLLLVGAFPAVGTSPARDAFRTRGALGLLGTQYFQADAARDRQEKCAKNKNKKRRKRDGLDPVCPVVAANVAAFGVALPLVLFS